jgi:PAS domain S-box-containing protein
VRHRSEWSPVERGEWYAELVGAITKAQALLIGRIRPRPLFEGLLQALLRLSQSEYGFIGEVLHDESGAPYLRTRGITDIAWNQETRRLFDENSRQGLEFHNLDTLFGAGLTSEKPVISNTPGTDPRRGGLPLGHPPLEAFLGVPLHAGGAMVGMIGVANRPGGYDDEILQDLEPFAQTCANAIFAVRAEAQRHEAEEKLRQEEARSRAMLDGVPAAIFTIAEDGRIEAFNPAAETMFGYTASEIIGRSCAELLPEAHRAAALEQLRRYFHEPERFRQLPVLQGRRQNGEEFRLRLTGRDVHVGDRRLYMGIGRDLAERDETERRMQDLEAELERSRFGQMVGRSREMQRLYETIRDVAAGDWTTLIEGETGSGKELVARALHAASSRANGPFIVTNVAGLTDSLVGSQLFGHRRGAFTGALHDQLGVFEAADGGTLFLDEIAGVSEAVQVALLRVLENQEIVRLGEVKPRKVNVRVLAASNQNLEPLVADGRFREDLFYRLRVARVPVPPLRARRDDIPLLVEAFLAGARVATGKAISGFEAGAMRRLLAYDWPGNVRELRNVVDYASIHSRSATIDVENLPPEISAVTLPHTPEPEPAPAPESEKARIVEALARAGGNRTQAARLLGISRATLYRRLTGLQAELRSHGTEPR